MRWPIRYQLLVPPLTLLLGVVAITTQTAIASADRARQQIEAQVQRIAHALADHPVGLSPTVLQMMKTLTGAEYLLVGPGERFGTFDVADVTPPALTLSEDWRSLRLGPRLDVVGKTYFCSGVRLQRGNSGKVLYVLYPEALWRDARWEAVRPSLILGGFAALASLTLAVGVGQRLSRRIQELELRTRLIAAGDFSSMPLPGRDDELRDLGRSVNEMACRLAQLQETIGRSERLRLLGQVSAGLAHQLRNGLTGARLAVQLHARECAGQADPEPLQVALRELTLLEAHLKRLLDLGHADARRSESCSLSDLLEEVVTLLRPRCRHTETELRWQPPDRAVLVSGDGGQLGQLFLNLLSNATEAAGPGGWVEVELQPEAKRDGADPYCAVEVADSGPGPAPEVAQRLFEPFVTGKSEGVGLGLAVSRQVAEAHGGHITWRRESGRTVFRVELPLLAPSV
jgi:signal transduction histidine kinase